MSRIFFVIPSCQKLIAMEKPLPEAPMLSEVLCFFSRRFSLVLYTQSVGIPARTHAAPATTEPAPSNIIASPT